MNNYIPCLVLSLSSVFSTSGITRLEGESIEGEYVSSASWLRPENENEKAVLSGGDWLTFSEAGTTLEWVLPSSEVEQVLWVRSFGRGWEYRVAGGEWLLPSETDHGSMAMVREGKRYFTARWKLVGRVPPSKEPLFFEVRGKENARSFFVAIDCLDLREVDDVPPQGWWLGDTPEEVELPEGWIAFFPEDRPAPLLLGPANIKPAGTLGQLERKGSVLQFKKGDEPVRFWGVTASVRDLFHLRNVDMERLGKLLASRGINLVRVHAAPYLEEKPGPLTDGIQRFVAAMKAEGIYVGIDWLCTATDRVQADWNIPGYEGGEGIQNMLYFSEAFRARVKARGRNLLCSPNPYTGIPLADDPAVAFVMLMDEDSVFFWTFNPKRWPTAFKELVEARWSAWVKAKYGSLQKALEAWGETDGQFLAGLDNLSQEHLALYASMHLIGAPWAKEQRNTARAVDQACFMLECARSTYASLSLWLKKEVGYEGVVIYSNWKTADEQVLGPLEYSLYSSADATARNTYFAAKHHKEKFFPWMPGDVFASRSLLKNPWAALITHPQLESHPHFLTEGGYEMPNRLRAEEPLLVAAYYALQGIDAYLPFQLEAGWNWDMYRWPFMTPVTFGQSPAASIIFREGYIEEAPIVYRDTTPLENLLQLKGGKINVEQGLDEVQGAHVPESMKEGKPSKRFDPLAFYVGRVTRSPGGEGLKESILAEHIDHQNKVVRSYNGNLMLDYGRGLLRIDAGHAQGGVGFFDTIETQLATFTQEGLHGAMVWVSLDRKPLSESKHSLLQVMTEEQSYGFKTEPAVFKGKDGRSLMGEKILENGRAPLLLRAPRGRVQFKDFEGLEISALDLNGQEVASRVTLSEDGTMILLPSAFYYFVDRK